MKIPNQIKYIMTLFAILIGLLGGYFLTKITCSIDTLEPMDILFSTAPFISGVFLLYFFAISHIFLFISAYVIHITNKYNF